MVAARFETLLRCHLHLCSCHPLSLLGKDRLALALLLHRLLYIPLSRSPRMAGAVTFNTSSTFRRNHGLCTSRLLVSNLIGERQLPCFVVFNILRFALSYGACGCHMRWLLGPGAGIGVI